REDHGTHEGRPENRGDQTLPRADGSWTEGSQGLCGEPVTERVMLKLRRLLNWLALLCLAGFFFPYFQHTTIQGVSEKKFTLGVPFSPWLIASWKKAEDRIEKNE